MVIGSWSRAPAGRSARDGRRATGGKSIPKIGATGLGYDLARQFGLRLVETRPALVPLTLRNRIWRCAVRWPDCRSRHGSRMAGAAFAMRCCSRIAG
ncbi:NAD(P)/FAD-dependent oxidoreductase [Paracoccus marcusii]|nr:NAD(P)/FAD-dependent oxidoreductase [Paracoccus marcusii]